MAGRKTKLTTNAKDRKDQRERTKQLQKHDAVLDQLQVTPPAELLGVGRRAYSLIVKQLNKSNLIKQIDIHLVVELCKQIQISRTAYESIYKPDDKGHIEGIQTPIYKPVQDASGQILETVFTGYRRNPAVDTLDKATKNIRSLSSELGMSPSSRASLLDLIKSDDTDKVSAADIMGKINTGF